MKYQRKTRDKEGRIVKAGGVVVKKVKGEPFILLLYRVRFNDWGFPKGHVEKDEDILESAKREIKEECGIDVKKVKELPPSEYAYSSRTRDKVCVRMYLFKSLTDSLKCESRGDCAEWVPLGEVRDKLTRDYLKEYFDLIKDEIS